MGVHNVLARVGSSPWTSINMCRLAGTIWGTYFTGISCRSLPQQFSQLWQVSPVQMFSSRDVTLRFALILVVILWKLLIQKFQSWILHAPSVFENLEWSWVRWWDVSDGIDSRWSVVQWFCMSNIRLTFPASSVGKPVTRNFQMSNLLVLLRKVLAK